MEDTVQRQQQNNVLEQDDCCSIELQLTTTSPREDDIVTTSYNRNTSNVLATTATHLRPIPPPTTSIAMIATLQQQQQQQQQNNYSHNHHHPFSNKMDNNNTGTNSSKLQILSSSTSSSASWLPSSPKYTSPTQNKHKYRYSPKSSPQKSRLFDAVREQQLHMNQQQTRIQLQQQQQQQQQMYRSSAYTTATNGFSIDSSYSENAYNNNNSNNSKCIIPPITLNTFTIDDDDELIHHSYNIGNNNNNNNSNNNTSTIQMIQQNQHQQQHQKQHQYQNPNKFHKQNNDESDNDSLSISHNSTSSMNWIPKNIKSNTGNGNSNSNTNRHYTHSNDRYNTAVESYIYGYRNNNNNNKNLLYRYTYCCYSYTKRNIHVVLFCILAIVSLTIGILLGTYDKTLTTVAPTNIIDSDYIIDNDSSTTDETKQQMRILHSILLAAINNYYYDHNNNQHKKDHTSSWSIFSGISNNNNQQQYQNQKQLFNSTISSQYNALKWIVSLDTYTMIQHNMTDTNFIPYLLERYALVVFYYSLYNNNNKNDNDHEQHYWSIDANFLQPDVSVCNWYKPITSTTTGSTVLIGIFCNNDNTATGTSSNTQVKSIMLPSNNLVGTIPSELSLLQQLQSINLYNNHIYGTIPLSIQYNTNLQSITLRNNNIKDDISIMSNEWLMKLINLISFDVSDNMIYGTIPIKSLGQSLTNLRELKIERNYNIHGTINEFQSIQQLNVLAIGNNNFTGTIDNTLLQSLSELEIFDASYNQITGTIPNGFFMSSISKIRILDLHSNQLNGTMPIIGNVDDDNDNQQQQQVLPNTNLKVLAIQNNQLSGPMVTQKHIDTGMFSSIVHLDLSNNTFTGTMASEIGMLRELQYLFLAFNTKLQTGFIPSELFTNLVNLKDISLQNTNRNGPIPETVISSTNLVLLDISNNDVYGQLPIELVSLEQLRYVLLQNNPYILGTIPLSYNKLLSQLDTFVIYGTGIQPGSTSTVCSTTDSVNVLSSIQNFVADCTVLTDCVCCTQCCQNPSNNDTIDDEDTKYSDCSSDVWYSTINPNDMDQYTRVSYSFNYTNDDTTVQISNEQQQQQLINTFIAEHANEQDLYDSAYFKQFGQSPSSLSSLESSDSNNESVVYMDDNIDGNVLEP